MRFRKLRIAFFATCLIVRVLMIVLWVRSYWRADVLHSPNSIKAYEVWLLNGRLIADWGFYGGGNGHLQWTSRLPESAPVDWSKPIFGFALTSTSASMPICPAIGISGTLAAVPWTSRRFSLRTLLIAMTLVAFVLGAIVYAVR